MSQSINSYQSFCIIRLSSIGDITHMIPVIRTLQDNNPKSDITWIIGKTEYSLVKNMKNIEFIIIDKRKFWSTLLTMISIRRKRVFGVLLHMQVSFRSNLISLFVNSRRKIGFNHYYSKNLHSLFVDEVIQAPERIHVLDVFFYFLEALGIKRRSLNWDINIDCKKMQKPLDERYVVINPFTSSRFFNYREWDLNNYAKIIDYLHKKYNVKTILVGGDNDNEIVQSVLLASNCKDVLNLVGKTSLKELYNILYHSELYIGPDSGTLHIASMVHKPIIGLFSSSNPDRTGPYNNREYIINKYDEALLKYNNKVSTQVKWVKRVRKKNVMLLIQSEDVLEKIDKILNF